MDLREIGWGWGVDSSGSGKGQVVVVGSCEFSDEPSGSSAMELVSYSQSPNHMVYLEITTSTKETRAQSSLSTYLVNKHPVVVNQMPTQ
jgi:hypothetical protein